MEVPSPSSSGWHPKAVHLLSHPAQKSDPFTTRSSHGPGPSLHRGLQPRPRQHSHPAGRCAAAGRGSAGTSWCRRLFAGSLVFGEVGVDKKLPLQPPLAHPNSLLALYYFPFGWFQSDPRCSFLHSNSMETGKDVLILLGSTTWVRLSQQLTSQFAGSVVTTLKHLKLQDPKLNIWKCLYIIPLKNIIVCTRWSKEV